MNASLYFLPKTANHAMCFWQHFFMKKQTISFGRLIIEEMYETTWHVSCAVKLLDSALATQ